MQMHCKCIAFASAVHTGKCLIYMGFSGIFGAKRKIAFSFFDKPKKFASKKCVFIK